MVLVAVRRAGQVAVLDVGETATQFSSTAGQLDATPAHHVGAVGVPQRLAHVLLDELRHRPRARLSRPRQQPAAHVETPLQLGEQRQRAGRA